MPAAYAGVHLARRLIPLAILIALVAPGPAAAGAAECALDDQVVLVLDGAACSEAQEVARGYARSADGGGGCDPAGGNTCPLEVAGWRCLTPTSAAAFISRASTSAISTSRTLTASDPRG